MEDLISQGGCGRKTPSYPDPCKKDGTGLCQPSVVAWLPDGRLLLWLSLQS